MTTRLLIVSNRLPVSVSVKKGELRFHESVGGLVSGISAYLDSLKSSSFAESESIWVGWPGISIDARLKEKLKSSLASDFKAHPAFLSTKVIDNFYYGFCNRTIWPLFHYFPYLTVYDEEDWITYKKVNELFCEAVSEIIKPDDIVWVHDYHLMLLPRLLREKMPDIPIGFFLHIPFPSYEIFRLLPREWGREILEGLLGADLIGFHTHDYTQYFLRCILRTLGYEHDMGKVIMKDRIIKADTFPMGIHFDKFQNAIAEEEVQRESQELKKAIGDLKVVLSIDRLDYTKGIINRLQGYEIFLERNPQWHKRLVLVVVVVPSRLAVKRYQQMKLQIDEIIGRINGRFGSIGWTPILYQYRFLPFNPLVALYSISDVALITPLRDGMNLIAKEYIATRTDKTGVLILSEMTGAAKELAEAIIINPNNKEEVASALKTALEMPRDEQVRRNETMQERLKIYNVTRWANDFINELVSIKKEQQRFNVRLLGSHLKDRLIQDFKKASRRIIFLDYDGTVVPLVGYPSLAKPDEKVLKFLKILSDYPNADLVITSGRDKGTLQNWFGSLNIGLIAEHGVWLKEMGKDWQLIKPLVNSWKPQILSTLKIYSDRLPRSFVEEKDFSVAWHYRKADPEQASVVAQELVDEVVNFTANIDLQVMHGSKVVEVRSSGVNKGLAGLYWLSKDKYDFIMAIGDDWTDEDLFKVLPQTTYSIKVGLTSSFARFNLRDYTEVQKLIEEIVK